MDDLIEALKIFRKYDNPQWPTHCEHDVLYIVGDFDIERMHEADVKRLDELGFHWDEDDESWQSFKFGSA